MLRRACHFIDLGKSFCSSVSVNKGSLAKLRKSTGYTFANCKKALQLHNNDITQAEKWLREQAQQMGWAKATKLEGRPTLHGLVAVCVDRATGIMVEVNSETDFVARNNNFHSLVETVASTCFHFMDKKDFDLPLAKFQLGQEELKGLVAGDGRPLADHLALAMGQLGENLTVRRAACLRAGPGAELVGHAHPSHPSQPSQAGAVLRGKYAALVALQGSSPALRQLGRQLCQHVVGMNPAKFGEPGVDEPAADPDEERCMIHQEFLLDPSITVGQLLAVNGASVLGFERFECGEALGSSSVEPPVNLHAQIGG
ncbi:elongation factor Ts, mitochondrial [Bacillus rossius redtenbacheri]|uniref:elongation factor Ts, mitochondrial n=1 Tax=Bacillus rossius redtenbacheri TaxID=93214 RepID=UPI002FDE8BA1